ncbi:MAG: phosphoribosylformylglycinamidine synthase subunit PurS [Bacillota bacterium]
MFLARIYITLKHGVLDPQGQAVQSALAHLGYDQVDDLRVGKFMELKLEAAGADEAGRLVDEMCQKLLANPVIENYRYEISEL